MQLNYVNNFGSELGLADMQERDPKRGPGGNRKKAQKAMALSSQDSGLISGAGKRRQEEVGGTSGKQK